MVGLVCVAVCKPVVLSHLLLRIIVLLGNAGNSLHFTLFEFTLTVAELVADTFVFLYAGSMLTVLLFQLCKV